MALYTDPVTGQQTKVDGPLVCEPRGGRSSIAWIVLLAALISGGVIFSKSYGVRDAPNSTIVNPVTSPSDSNASPIHPAPSPNPGP